MQDEERLSELIGAIYEAAADAERWAEFLDLLKKTFQSTMSAFFVQDLVTNEVPLYFVTGLSDTGIQEYQDYYAGKNILFEVTRKTRACEVLSTSKIEKGLFDKSEFKNDFLGKEDLYHSIHSALIKDGGRASNITIMRPERVGEFSSAEESFFRILIPHMRRAIQIHYRLGCIEWERNAALNSLDHLPTGVMLVDDTGCVVVMNREAREIVKAGDGLAVGGNGELRAAVLLEGHKLRKLISEAVGINGDGGVRSGGAMTVSRPSGKRTYSILAAPIKASRFDTGSRTKAAAVVFIGDPESEPRPAVEILCTFYGITRAEARVLQGLCLGKRIEDIADDQGQSRETIRSHVKSLLFKTGSSRQSDLVRLVLSGPAAYTLGDQ